MLIEEVLDEALAGGYFAGPADDEMIRSAEAQLGVQFPDSYKLFLARYGAVMCTGFEIAGVFVQANDALSLWWDVVSLNRPRYAAIPPGYVAISNDGTDYMYYLDTDRLDSNRECPVVVLGPGAHDVIVAKDFVEFVILGVKHQIDF